MTFLWDWAQSDAFVMVSAVVMVLLLAALIAGVWHTREE